MKPNGKSQIRKTKTQVPKAKKVAKKDDKFVKGKKILSIAIKQLQEDEEEKGAVGGVVTLKEVDEDIDIDDVDVDSNDDESPELDAEDAAALKLFCPRDDTEQQQQEEEETEALTETLSRGADLHSSMPPPAQPPRPQITGKASGGATGTWISIGDLLRERVTDARTEIESQLSDMSRASSITSPELKEMFAGLRQVLANYTHGQFPKLLKQVPHMQNCQDVVEELQPEKWSSGSMSTMTKFFVAKGGDVAAYFLTEILLPRIRDHIAEYGKLNPTLIDAMHRALFITKVFFPSFLIPLIQDRHNPCTLAEATIIAGLLKKAHVNPRYGGAALVLLVREPYTPAQTLFIRTLLDKNYKLLDSILEQVHVYFMKFADMSEAKEDQYFTDENRMPVLWFQTFLIYAKMYKDFWSKSPEKCKDLLRLCRVHTHPQITNAIRHEIITASASGGLDMDVDDK